MSYQYAFNILLLFFGATLPSDAFANPCPLNSSLFINCTKESCEEAYFVPHISSRARSLKISCTSELFFSKKIGPLKIINDVKEWYTGKIENDGIYLYKNFTQTDSHLFLERKDTSCIRFNSPTEIIITCRWLPVYLEYLKSVSDDITLEQFIATQEKQQNNKEDTGRAMDRYIKYLLGFIGVCGSAYIGWRRRKKQKNKSTTK